MKYLNFKKKFKRLKAHFWAAVLHPLGVQKMQWDEANDGFTAKQIKSGVAQTQV